MRLYFRDTSSNAAGIVATNQSAMAADVANPMVRDLAETTGPTSGTVDSISGPLALPLVTTRVRGYFGKWVSAPLTGITTLNGQPYNFILVGNESLATSQQYFTAAGYVVKADGSIRGFAFDSDVEHGTEIPTAAAGRSFQITGVAVSGIIATDRLVIEVWHQGVPTTATACNMRFRYDGNTVPADAVANTNAASFVEFGQSGLFDVAAPPPVASTTLYMRTTTDNVGTFAATEKSAAMTAATSINAITDLSLQKGTSPSTYGSLFSSATTAAQTGYARKFITAPINPSVSSIPAGPWEIGFVGWENAAGADAQLALSVYVLKSDDTVRGYAYDSGVPLGNEFSSGSTYTTQIVGFTGAAVTGIVSTDRLVVEYWIYATQTAANSQERRFYFDGPNDLNLGVSQNRPAAYVLVPVAGLVANVTGYGPTGGATPSGNLGISKVAPLNLGSGGAATPTGVLTLATKPTLSTGVLAGEARPTGSLTVSKISQSVSVGETGGSGSRQPWLSFCGQEVMNAARTVEYIKRLQPKIDVLDDTHPVLYHTTGMEVVYEHPASDPAPWYDPADNRSAEFLGMLGTISEVSTPTARTVTALDRGGAQLGPPRLGPRTLTIKGFLIATTWAGQEFGREWLSEALSGCSGCALCDTQVLLWAPTIDRLDSTDGRYTLYDTALTDGPKQTAALNCPELMQVEFTITSEHGEWYADPILRSGVEEIPVPGFPAGCVPFDEWLCGQPAEGVDAFILSPQMGTQSVIVQIDATGGGANGLEIGLYSDCSALDEPLARIVVDQLPAGSYLTVDSSRQRVVVVDAEGTVRDGIGYLTPDPNFDIEWMQLDSCDTPACVVVRRLANCSETTNVKVAILTQLRVR